MSGPASLDELHALQRLVLRQLTRRVADPEAPAELLGVARSFLRDQAPTGFDLKDDEREKARRLFLVLIDQLAARIEGGEGTAALLAVALHVLRDAGITQGRADPRSVAEALRALTAADIPFKVQ